MPQSDIDERAVINTLGDTALVPTIRLTIEKPKQDMPNNRLRVAVVGGGIGGLAAANALVQRGADVTVLEQAAALGEVGAGILIYPNSLRQLERMGLGEPLAKVGAKVGDGSGYFRMDGTTVGKILTTDSERMERRLRNASGRFIARARGRHSASRNTHGSSLYRV